MVFLYIKSVLGTLEKQHDRTISKAYPIVKNGVSWKAHIEKELGIDRNVILEISTAMTDLSSEDKSYLLLATLKRGSVGWFSTYDEELRVLRLKGLSDW
jgi:hypothetical protein